MIMLINRLKNIKVKLGGGANDMLLYFFVRYFKPKVVLETELQQDFLLCQF